MKWKSDVTVERKKTYKLKQERGEKVVEKEDYYIIDAIEQGITDDKKLCALVAEKEKTDDVVTRFRLAQFILDYGEYISNEVGHVIIEP